MRMFNPLDVGPYWLSDPLLRLENDTTPKLVLIKTHGGIPIITSREEIKRLKQKARELKNA